VLNVFGTLITIVGITGIAYGCVIARDLAFLAAMQGV